LARPAFAGEAWGGKGLGREAHLASPPGLGIALARHHPKLGRGRPVGGVTQGNPRRSPSLILGTLAGCKSRESAVRPQPSSSIAFEQARECSSKLNAIQPPCGRSRVIALACQRPIGDRPHAPGCQSEDSRLAPGAGRPVPTAPPASMLNGGSHSAGDCPAAGHPHADSFGAPGHVLALPRDSNRRLEGSGRAKPRPGPVRGQCQPGGKSRRNRRHQGPL